MTITANLIPALNEEQQAVVAAPFGEAIFLEGCAGSGKTTAGVARLQHLLASSVPAESILLLVPQRTLAWLYQAMLNRTNIPAGGLVNIVTIGGLAQRLTQLFWPLAAEAAGFAHPELPPVFLTLETAQYYLSQVLQPLLARGYFQTITVNRNRLYSQIIDNLNKAAAVGFDYREIGSRLASALPADEGQMHAYQEAQEAAALFREHCLANNLLDFSLQIEVFHRYLWPEPLCQSYLHQRYQHLIYDNIEEDTPVAHDCLRDFLPSCHSALLIYDQDAGYRRFLGADPVGAYRLKELCPQKIAFTANFISSPPVQALTARLQRAVLRQPSQEAGQGDARQALSYAYQRYQPQMLDWAAAETAHLVHENNTPPGEIVILAPFLSDALRFSLSSRLAAYGIPVRTHRPSRALRDEPAARSLFTLAALAHPDWGIVPRPDEVASALSIIIDGLDPVRAHLFSQVIYNKKSGQLELQAFEDVNNRETQERLTFKFGEIYNTLRQWLLDYQKSAPLALDHFWARLFGECLSQPGFSFHSNLGGGAVAANLIESARKFRWVANGVAGETAVAREYMAMVQDGVVAAQYISNWQPGPDDAVLIAPAHTFLMSNRPVDYQFWLDIGSGNWWERLFQPLTHPYVLSRHWPQGKVWTDSDETRSRQQSLHMLTGGLLHRCRRGVFLGLSELGEEGREEQGPLLLAIQRVLRELAQEAADVQA